MRLPFSRSTLVDWAGSQVFGDAQQLWRRGAVRRVEYDPPMLTGRVEWGTRQIRAAVRIDADGSAENECPCHDSRERGIICAHVVALGLAMLEESFDPRRSAQEKEERRKAEALAQIGEDAYLTRVAPHTAGATPARLELALAADWRRQAAEGRLEAQCNLELDGAWVSLESAPRDRAYWFSPADEALLFVWEDIAGGPGASRQWLSTADFINVLELRRGAALREEGADATISVQTTKVPSTLRVDLDPETGELVVDLDAAPPTGPSGERPIFLISARAGWMVAGGDFWPLASVLPEPFHGVYRHAVRIPREGAPQFMRSELARLADLVRVETELSEDSFVLIPDTPRLALEVRGSCAALSASAYAAYGDVRFSLGKEAPGRHFARPDPQDLFRYAVRDLNQERVALRRLREIGFAGPAGDELAGLVGTRNVYNFLGRDLPALRRAGWRVALEGRVADEFDRLRFATPVVQVRQPGDHGGWFEVHLGYEDPSGSALSGAEIQRALRKGDAFLDNGNGVLLLDSEAIGMMQEVFEDCAAGEGQRPGSFRLAELYAPYVKASLDAIDGIDVEADRAWLERADHFNRPRAAAPRPIPPSLDGVLRPYQVDGVHWLEFLDEHALGGILADEMGLGKTLQTLTWLLGRRGGQNGHRRPALIVCPTSLVENWAEESARFTPQLDVVVIAGAKREQAFAQVEGADLVITSYALLRRDLERYAPLTFSAMVLDEAQHIKNHATQNARAAKAVRAERRLVLTGTPIENSVSDLWSIMDFLMPGYLGDHPSFRERYELPISRGNHHADSAQARLRRKLNPFLLRRLKRHVARDLPPKIERVARFRMSPDQHQVYREVLRSSQQRLTDLVARQGFHRSRMDVLSTLLRLRQICCHLDLIDLPGLRPEQPSAKLDLFMELLAEARDGGHRVLVFSQFVAMLTILRETLEREGVPYCYLDGSTTHRQAEVNRFNRSADIPVFLISLKAGGTGLNLTGADMVIHFDPWWNPAVEAQATDRAYRIGQQRTVYSIKLIARDSVEEKVLALQAKKQAVINATLETDGALLDQLDWDDVKALLSL